MDVQPHLSYLPEAMSLLHFAAAILPVEEYATTVTTFPGMNCFPPYATSGSYFLSFTFYQNGKKIGEIHTEACDENGCIRVEFDDFFEMFPTKGECFCTVEYHHAENSPPELYFAAVHRATGTYVAYPAGNYMGDIIRLEPTKNVLVNTLFWPGVVANQALDEYLVVANPYRVSYSYQVSLYTPAGRRYQTDVMRIRPLQQMFLRLRDLFPSQYEEIEQSGGQASFCIAGQYRVVAFVMIKNREQGIVTTLDHLHVYQLL